MIRIKCSLGFFDEFPEYTIPDEELDYGPHYSLIRFNIHTYQVRCATHGIISNGTSVFRI